MPSFVLIVKVFKTYVHMNTIEAKVSYHQLLLKRKEAIKLNATIASMSTKFDDQLKTQIFLGAKGAEEPLVGQSGICCGLCR